MATAAITASRICSRIELSAMGLQPGVARAFYWQHLLDTFEEDV